MKIATQSRQKCIEDHFNVQGEEHRKPELVHVEEQRRKPELVHVEENCRKPELVHVDVKSSRPELVQVEDERRCSLRARARPRRGAAAATKERLLPAG